MIVITYMGLGTGICVITGKAFAFSTNIPARMFAAHAAARGIHRVTSVVMITLIGEIDVTLRLGRAIR